MTCGSATKVGVAAVSWIVVLAFPANWAAAASEEHFSPNSWRQAGRSSSRSWSRALMLTELRGKTKLEGMDRRNVLALLGEPQRSDEVLPHCDHRGTVDFYSLSSRNDQHFRIEYDSQDRVLSSYVEPTPLLLPKFMGQSQPVTLPASQLQAFLSGNSEEMIRKMSAGDVKRLLGAPGKSWRNKSQAGGRDRHWLTYLYFLDPAGRKAFAVIFNAESDQIYEYRLQTIAVFK